MLDSPIWFVIWYFTNTQIQIFIATLFSYIASVGEYGFHFLATRIYMRTHTVAVSFTVLSMVFWLASVIANIYSAIFLFHMRRYVIKQFNMRESSFTTCLVSFFCFPCSTAQMARHVLHYDTDGGPGCCDPGPKQETQEQTKSLYDKGM